MTAKEDWKKADRERRFELQEERVLRAFSAPMAVLPRASRASTLAQPVTSRCPAGVARATLRTSVSRRRRS